MSNGERRLRYVTGWAVLTLGIAFTAGAWGSGYLVTFLVMNTVISLASCFTWPVTWALRLLRLSGGGLAALTGGLLALEAGFAVQFENSEAAGKTLVALFMALVIGVIGTGAADLTIAHRADRESALRHAELLAAVRDTQPGAARRLRLADCLLAIVAVMILRRRRARSG